jgi:hypothetical protein
MPIIPRTKKPKEIKTEPEVIQKEEPVIEDSEDPLKRRMMDSPSPSEKQTEQVYELRETVYDNTSRMDQKSDNIFKSREPSRKFDHTIEFGKLDKLKSERDLDPEKTRFISLKDNVTDHDKSFKVIQNKNSNHSPIRNT